MAWLGDIRTCLARAETLGFLNSVLKPPAPCDGAGAPKAEMGSRLALGRVFGSLTTLSAPRSPIGVVIGVQLPRSVVAIPVLRGLGLFRHDGRSLLVKHYLGGLPYPSRMRRSHGAPCMCLRTNGVSLGAGDFNTAARTAQPEFFNAPSLGMNNVIFRLTY